MIFGHNEGRFTPWIMKSDQSRWLFPIVWFDGATFMVRILKKSVYKVFGPLTRCRPESGPKRMTMHQKVNVLIFVNTCSKRIVSKQIQVWSFSFVFFCLQRLFPPKIYIIIKFLWMGPCLFLPKHLFTSPTGKSIGPCQWIMCALTYIFWKPRTSWSLWHFFLGVNWSGPETSFNSQ